MRGRSSGSAIDQNRQLARALQRADLAAQPQPVEIGEAEADDQEVEIVLGAAQQRLMRRRFRLRPVMSRAAPDDPLRASSARSSTSRMRPCRPSSAD